MHRKVMQHLFSLEDFPTFQVQALNGNIHITENCQSRRLASLVCLRPYPTNTGHSIPGILAPASEEKWSWWHWEEKNSNSSTLSTEQRYSARETEVCNSIWMITEGMSQPHVATACIVYVSHSALSLSMIHLYLFYSIRVARNCKLLQKTVTAPPSAEFSKTLWIWTLFCIPFV